MKQSNGCSTPPPRSSAAEQWFEQLAQKTKKTTFTAYYDKNISLQTISMKEAVHQVGSLSFSPQGLKISFTVFVYYTVSLKEHSGKLTTHTYKHCKC